MRSDPDSKRADHDVVPIGIAQRELPRSGGGINVGLFFELRNESARPLQCHIEIVDAKEQKQAIAGRRVFRTGQRRMLMCTPRVKAEQDGPVRVQDLTKVVMSGRRFRLAKERLVPLEAGRYVSHTDDCPRTFH